jgi:hypothetical protein
MNPFPTITDDDIDRVRDANGIVHNFDIFNEEEGEMMTDCARSFPWNSTEMVTTRDPPTCILCLGLRKTEPVPLTEEEARRLLEEEPPFDIERFRLK